MLAEGADRYPHNMLELRLYVHLKNQIAVRAYRKLGLILPLIW